MKPGILQLYKGLITVQLKGVGSDSEGGQVRAQTDFWCELDPAQDLLLITSYLQVHEETQEKSCTAGY